MKNILVTGVSRGMGLATARLLAKEGCFIYGVYNTDKETAEQLKNEDKNVELFQCNFSDRKNIAALIKQLKNVRLNGIVNSAGVFIPIEFNEFKMEDWDKTFEVNLVTPLLLVEGLKDNLESGGAIVNISSTDGMTGALTGIAYSASKAALINLTQSLANILAKKKIRVNAIAPGWIGDGMRAPKELLKEAGAYSPSGRLGTYEEIANIISFLLSEKSSYMNGTTLVVDGGDSATNYILKKEAEM